MGTSKNSKYNLNPFTAGKQDYAAFIHILLFLKLGILLGVLLNKDSVDLWLRLTFFIPGVIAWIAAAYVQAQRYRAGTLKFPGAR